LGNGSGLSLALALKLRRCRSNVGGDVGCSCWGGWFEEGGEPPARDVYMGDFLKNGIR
jgi:hypothetical protein